MFGIKSIIYERNAVDLIININNQSNVIYLDNSRLIDNKLIMNYLEKFLSIIELWQEKYIDTKIIDGDIWKLSIIYDKGGKKEFWGKAKFPKNFEALERLNQKLIDEVLNG